MSETISDKEKSKKPDASTGKVCETEAIRRITDILELWSKHADNEFEFGVLRGLQVALDVLNGI